VDVPQIQAIVAGLLHPATPAPTGTSSPRPSATSGSTPTPTAPAAPKSYTDSEQPMPSGAVPCVN